MNLDITVQIPMQRVYDTIVNAFDNRSSNYWCDLGDGKFKLPKGFDVSAVEWLDADDRRRAAVCRTDYLAMLVPGGWIDVVEHDTGDKRRITFENVKRGLALLVKVCPKAFADMISEDGDIWTSDALMQCIVLHEQIAERGELIYG